MEAKKNAALAVYKAAVHIMTNQDRTANITTVAKELGVDRSGFSRLVNGYHDVTINRLQEWLKTWEDKGNPPICLAMSADEVRLLHEHLQKKDAAPEAPSQ